MRRSYEIKKLARRRRQPAELLLVPMIDIFTVLVTFLLMTAVFSRTVVLEHDLPARVAQFRGTRAGQRSRHAHRVFEAGEGQVPREDRRDAAPRAGHLLRHARAGDGSRARVRRARRARHAAGGAVPEHFDRRCAHMMSNRARRMAEHHARHRADAQLNLIPLIDILSVMVSFLLVYSTEVEVIQNTKGIDIPQSIAEAAPHRSVVVMVT